jgi:IS30 family transposase
MKNERWTNEQDDVIEEGIRDGLSYREIAQKLGRTEASVSQRTHVMRAKYSRYNTSRSKDPTTEEIRSIADDNRIWIAMVSASIAAFCSVIILIICVGAML